MQEQPQNKTEIKLDSRISIKEYANDAISFPEGAKDKLITASKDLIDAVERKIGEQKGWLLSFFLPKNEEEVERKRRETYREMQKYGGFTNTEDLLAMKEAGLTLGGVRTPQEEVDKAVRFLIEREMDRQGILKSLTKGHVVIDLNGKQVSITEDGYSNKYGGKTDLAGAVEYLTS